MFDNSYGRCIATRNMRKSLSHQTAKWMGSLSVFQEREIFGIRITLLCKGRSHLQSPILKSCHLRIHGQRDPVILASDLEELRQLGNVKIVKLETAGYFIPLLAAQYFNALLLDFLSMEHGSL